MPKGRASRLTEEKRNLIGELISLYDIKNGKDIEEALMDASFVRRFG